MYLDESPYGVRDLAGNIREWCSDVYHKHSDTRVARGGAWGASEIPTFRAAARFWYSRQMVSGFLGFRMVRIPEKP